jgi:hypothetical protein
MIKNRICAFLFILFSFNTFVFALGKSQADDEINKQDNEWTLCVTDFDVKSLPQSKLSVASVITRKVVERLNEISYRTRVSPEYAWYEGYAWYKARLSAAKSLSAKLEERSLLIFNGETAWRYKQNLARVDTDIEKLTAAFEEIDNNAPIINNEPVFKLTDGNVQSSYPAPPNEKDEAKFCKDQKADAFLAGSVVEFHGRYIISIKLYAVYAKTFIYEDRIIFSPDDLDSALDEITSKLILTLSGSRHSAIVVKAEPADSLVLINRSFAGRGDTGIIERPPGKFEIIASANNHESITVETELAAGEIAEITIKLLPQEFANIEIPGTAAGITVYQGALYAGEAPLTLRLPVDTLEYVELESSDKLKGTAVFNTPEEINSTHSIPVKTGKPPVKGKVESARTLYYWSWGGVWITGLAAWIAYHSFTASNDALASEYKQGNELNPQFYDDNIRMAQIRDGTYIALGAVSAFWVFNIVRYLYLANRGATPVVKTSRNK